MLQNHPTVLLSQLPSRERDQYMQFLVENDVEFQEDPNGYYVTTIRMINPKSNNYAAAKQKKKETWTSRALTPTFSSKQKSVLKDVPKASQSPVKTRKRRQLKSSFTKTSLLQRKIEDLTLSDQKTQNKTRPKSANLSHFLQRHQLKLFLKQIQLAPSQQLRPQIMPIQTLIKTIEELYSAKFSRDCIKLEQGSQNVSTRSRNKPFYEFVANFYIQKYKSRRFIEQNALNLAQSVEQYSDLYYEIKLFQQLMQSESSEALEFFLLVRRSVERDLGVQLHGKHPGQVVQYDTRQVYLYGQDRKFIMKKVFVQEPDIQRKFLDKINNTLNEQEAQEGINLGKFLYLCVEFYRNMTPEVQVDTFTAGSHQNIETFPAQDSIEFLQSSFPSVELSPIQPNAIISPQKPDKTFDTFEGFATPSPQKQTMTLSQLKESCRSHLQNYTMQALQENILDNLKGMPQITIDAIKSKVQELLSQSIPGMTDAIFNGDKRLWLQIIRSDNSDQEALQTIEGLQKQARMLSRSPSIELSDIDLLCSSILENASVEKFVRTSLENEFKNQLINMSSNRQELNWAGNNISSMDTLHLFPDLTNLILSNNRIERITDLDHCPNLIEIKLDRNQITRIENLQSASNLKVLDLAFNKINRIERLDQLSKLQILNLSNNKIALISNLWRLSNLRVLWLDNNQIRNFGDLLSNTNLEELSLNHNQLSNLSKGSEFLPLSIKRLFLKGNQLEGMLTPRLLVPLEDLEEIDLSQNPLVSDIEMEGVDSRIFLLYLLRQRNIVKLNGEKVVRQEILHVKQLNETINPEILNNPDEMAYLFQFLAEKIPNKRRNNRQRLTARRDSPVQERHISPPGKMSSPRNFTNEPDKLDLISKQLQDLSEAVKMIIQDKQDASMQIQSPVQFQQPVIEKPRKRIRAIISVSQLNTFPVDLKKVKQQNSELTPNMFMKLTKIQGLVRRYLVRCRFVRFKRVISYAIRIQSVFRGYRVRKHVRITVSSGPKCPDCARIIKLLVPEIRSIREEISLMQEEQAALLSNSNKHEKALRYLFEQVSIIQKSMK